MTVLYRKRSARVERKRAGKRGRHCTATRDDRGQILLELEHADLPLLVETGLVAFDRETGTVRIEPLDDAVVDLIRRSVETDPPSV